MKRLKWLRFLMSTTLLIIIGFQIYWLKSNFDSEKKTLEIKTGVAFQETVRQLQTSKFKLPPVYINDTAHAGRAKVFIDKIVGVPDKKPGTLQRSQIITMVNNLRNSSGKENAQKTTLIITSDKKDTSKDPTNPLRIRRFFDSTHTFNILYGVDSLQDTLQIPEINIAYNRNLKKENLNVGFKITRSNGISNEGETELNDVTVGFAHPLTYHLILENTAAYLLLKIALPFFFSLFLISITFFSFALLYTNLIKQQKLSEIKNDLISNITHELKTPIATVGVAIEALKNFNAISDPEKTKEYLDISGNELQRLNLLVDKVLRLSMFEKKKIELNKEHFDLKDLTQTILDTMKLQFSKNNVAVDFKFTGNNFMIYADKLHITSVIYNLLDNALKYKKEDAYVIVEIIETKDSIELQIIDNGIGIAQEYQTKIFDKFFRVPMRNHNIKGYGLGLSYVSHTIEKHHGNITVQSEINKGSTFKIIIPRNHGQS